MELTIAEVLVHSSIGSGLGSLHTLSNEGLSSASTCADGASELTDFNP